MAHDFKAFPELTNQQMTFYYFDSPHEQITRNFQAKVTKVHDGDTIRVKTDFRDFEFPIRFSNISAAELNEEGGTRSRDWLASKIDGEEIYVIVDPSNRVGKFGRILGEIIHMGININEESMRQRQSIDFSIRHNVVLPDFKNTLEDFII